MFNLSEGQIALLIPVFALAIPIVAILTQHQRKMAEIMQGKKPTEDFAFGNRDAEVQALRQELYELKQLIHQQSIAIDNIASLSARTAQGVPPAVPPVMPFEERLHGR
ncbi:MAG: hypothetical protein ACOYON_11960 [Fimbriimonas sp.]